MAEELTQVVASEGCPSIAEADSENVDGVVL